MSRPLVLVLASDAIFPHFFPPESLARVEEVADWSHYAARDDTPFFLQLNYTLPQDLLKFRDAFTFSLVILILLWRPEGLVKGPASGQRT